jgi:hypothetical protein
MCGMSLVSLLQLNVLFDAMEKLFLATQVFAETARQANDVPGCSVWPIHIEACKYRHMVTRPTIRCCGQHAGFCAFRREKLRT